MKKPNPTGKEDKETKQQKAKSEGYPLYPDKDDIYSRSREDKDLDPEDLTRIKRSDDEDELDLEADEDQELDDEFMGGDLDVPGSELDDDMEDIGDEDEENNYYSIGGDKHADLDENNETEDDIII
jgi:hypothetical protein